MPHRPRVMLTRLVEVLAEISQLQPLKLRTVDSVLLYI